MSSQQPFNTANPVSPGNSLPIGGARNSLLGSQPQIGGSSAGGPSTQDGLGEVRHTQHLSEHIGQLFLRDEYSDVTLVVSSTRFQAHRVILAARSEYFRALLYGGMKESSQAEIELKDTPVNAFKHLLSYVYTGNMTLHSLKYEMVLEILGLAHQYGFQDLESAISDYFRASLSLKNVCSIYDTAALYQMTNLMNSCSRYMDVYASEILKTPQFKNLSPTGIRDILGRDSFCAPEVDIFSAVHSWFKANPNCSDETTRDILSSVRLSLMSTPELLKVVRPTGLVPPDVMLDAIQSKEESRDMELKYRGALLIDENVAQTRLGAKVLYGEVKQALLDGDSKNYDMEKGFSRHPIGDNNDTKGIIVEMGAAYIINNIKMLLWDRDQRAYSYYIEVSMDQKDWIKVVDYSRYHCRSWQILYFAPRVVRAIRIVGTHNTVNKVFHVVTLEAYYTKNVTRIDRNGILIPDKNVATIGMSACVTEGVCRSRNALLNGDTRDYDWDSGYTCHQLGSGAIIVQLGQPYDIDSMRLLLWDCDDRTYSYYIEVSTNDRDWEVVCDKSREGCRSWQVINFKRRPVVYIKIVGTQNTANEVFHCVHFECPSTHQVPMKSEKDDKSKSQLQLPQTAENEKSQTNQEEEVEEALEEAELEEVVEGAAALVVSHKETRPKLYDQSHRKALAPAFYERDHFRLGQFENESEPEEESEDRRGLD